MRTLATAVPNRYRAMVLLAGFGGLRWGEVAGLEVRHVNWADGCVKVRQQLQAVDGGTPTLVALKTDAAWRTVFLHPEVMDALRHHVDTYDLASLLFTTPTRDALRASNWRRKVWKPATKKAGCVGIRFHDLRHTAGTLAARTGATTKELMAHGPRDIHAAMRSQHATEDRQKAIADRMARDLAPDTNVVPLRPTADE
ncbi:MAG: site-specific integrase [Acidimicrobiales bacterium]|nr:site-specific integrase [Acidimicrobiales bacterium]